MTARVFIDGEAGTTGLQILKRLEGRTDLQLLQIDPRRRKDADARAEMLNTADLAILCLPDAAAREAVALVENDRTKVLDASSAHRTADGWLFGFPELDKDLATALPTAKRVSNPGCYATGSIALLKPLVEAGLLPKDYPLAISAVSGYSGGGRQMIEAYESEGSTAAPAEVYGLGLEHKHVPEIQRWSGLSRRPIFVPMVASYYKGMIVEIPLHLDLLAGETSGADLRAALTAHYAGGGFVSVAPAEESAAMQRLSPEMLNDTNEMRLHVHEHAENRQAVLVAVLDNLGKGASGAAVQNMNIMLGLDPAAGLTRAAAA